MDPFNCRDRVAQYALILCTLFSFVAHNAYAFDYVLADDTLVNGFIFKKGSTLTTTPDGKPVRGTLKDATKNGRFTWGNVDPVEFGKAEKIVKGSIGTVQTTKIGSVEITLKANTEVVLLNNDYPSDTANLKIFTLEKELPISTDVVAGGVLKANETVSFHDNSSVQSGYVQNVFFYQNFHFAAGLASFYEASKPLAFGALRFGKTFIDGWHYGIILPAKTELLFDKTASVIQSKSDKPIDYFKVIIPANSTIVWNGADIVKVWIQDDWAYGGKVFARQQFIPFNDIRQPYIPQVK